MAIGVTKDDLREWVHSFVWTGEYLADEIPLLIEDCLGVGDEVDEVWLKELIAAEFATKKAAEATWPAVTDWDRLDKAFQSLREKGVIALHLAGFTQSDGLEEVEDDYEDAGGEDSDYAGHCFYTEQDYKRAFGGEGLFVGFGHLSGNNANGVEVGQLVRSALEAEGLKVEWDGTIKSRAFIKSFHWQRRGPE
jgi:hypothetical protein